MNQPGTILYLEDDIGSQRLVQRVLESHGYRVLIAGEARRGIALAEAENPRLILMDINLPGMNGKEITTRLRSLPHFAETPIVALTANTGPGNREQALAAGCTGFMTKPIDVVSFPSRVQDYLDGRTDELSHSERSEQLEIYAQKLVERLEDKINELQVANQRLRDLDQMKSDFIALVSHELRTPLTLVTGYTYLIADKSKEVEAAGLTDLAPVLMGLSKGIERLETVINEIINVARIASGNLDLAIGPVRLQNIVTSILENHTDVVEMRNIQLQVNMGNSLPIIEGDGPRLRVALDNVIGNAIKYTPDDGQVIINVTPSSQSIRITVADTGVGIPVEEQKRIFEQFHILGSIKHHSTSKSNFQGGGLGLGLPIAKGIIEAHQGRIWVESERHDREDPPGSTFYISLPLQQKKRSDS